MLKRKLYKASLLATGFLLMAASTGSKPVIDQPGDTTMIACMAALHDSTLLKSQPVDVAGLCDCLAGLPEAERANVPRIELNRNAVVFVKDHQKKNGTGWEKLKTSGARQFSIIDKIFTQYGLPVELKYLAVVESKLNTRATSKAGAKGMWQFMPVPARQFGLNANAKYDQRHDAYKSTVAAAKLLSYLYGLFNDWLLTIAAYNSGPGGVYKAIKKSGSRDFWVLQRYLPAETSKHVKKFISTHYFYEGRGGLTTMTKSETKAHIVSVINYVETLKNNSREIDSLMSVAVESRL